MIKVIYNKVCGRCVQSEPLTSGMVGQTIHFEYSHDFDGLAVTAVFTDGKNTVDVVNPGNECVIPHEVLTTVGAIVKVGIYAARGDELVIPTIYAHIGVVLKGADPIGDVSIDPTLPVWAQIQGIIGNLSDLTTEAKNNLVAAINEAAQSGGGGGSSIALDTTLTQSGKAADAAVVGNRLSALSEEIANLQTSVLTTAQINALDGMFKVCAFTKDNVSAEYTAFKTAFGITDSGGGSGGGESGGTGVSNESTWTDGVPYIYDAVNNTYIESNGAETAYNTWSSSPYLYCGGASQLVFTVLLDTTMLSANNNYNAFYDENKTFISKFSIAGIGNASLDGVEVGATKEITIPGNAAYFRVSQKAGVYGNIDSDNPILSITPKA